MKKRRWQADPLSLQKVMNKTQLFTPEEQIKLTVPMKLAYEKLRTGAASEPDFHLLAACVNITMILSEKIGAEAVEYSIKARDAMMRCWERLNNPSFNSPGFEGIRSKAGLNRFTLSVRAWNQETNGIGLIAKAGRYGGTYAHKDIAFEFGSRMADDCGKPRVVAPNAQGSMPSTILFNTSSSAAFVIDAGHLGQLLDRCPK